MQAQRVVEQRLSRGVVEALGGAGGRISQRAGRQLEVAAQPGVLGNDHRISRPAARPGSGPPAGAAKRPARWWRSRRVPRGPARAGTSAGRPARPGTAWRQPAPRRSSSSMSGRPSTAASRSRSSSGPSTDAVRRVAPAEPSSSHRADTESTSERRQVAACRLLCQLGQEQRMAPGSRVQRVDPAGAHQLGGGVPGRARPDGRTAAAGSGSPRRRGSAAIDRAARCPARRMKCSRSGSARPARCASSIRTASGPRALRRPSTRASAA